MDGKYSSRGVKVREITTDSEQIRIAEHIEQKLAIVRKREEFRQLIGLTDEPVGRWPLENLWPN